MKKRLIIIPAVIIVCATGVIAGLELSNTTHWFHSDNAATTITKAGAASPAPKSNTSANAVSGQKQPAPGAPTNIGGANDTRGNASASTNSSQWITSKSGVITVKQPLADATLTSGDTLSGSAKVGQVQFRLIDNKVGVIATGPLQVVNGNFSGQLHFAPHSSTGRLDVFSLSKDGVEQNEIQIAVKF